MEQELAKNYDELCQRLDCIREFTEGPFFQQAVEASDPLFVDVRGSARRGFHKNEALLFALKEDLKTHGDGILFDKWHMDVYPNGFFLKWNGDESPSLMIDKPGFFFCTKSFHNLQGICDVIFKVHHAQPSAVIAPITNQGMVSLRQLYYSNCLSGMVRLAEAEKSYYLPYYLHEVEATALNKFKGDNM